MFTGGSSTPGNTDKMVHVNYQSFLNSRKLLKLKRYCSHWLQLPFETHYNDCKLSKIRPSKQKFEDSFVVLTSKDFYKMVLH